MATRCYLRYDGATPASVSWDASWERSNADAAFRTPLLLAKIGSTLSNRTLTTNTSGASDLGVVQHISPPLAAYSWTTGDTIKLQVRASRNTDLTSAYLRAVVRVVSNAGSTVRGTLYDGVGSTDMATALTNRNLGGAVNVQNAVTMQANDRLVVEIGARVTNPDTTWRGVVLHIGDSVATDLPENETATDYYTPWIEFSPDLSDVTLGVGEHRATTVIMGW